MVRARNFAVDDDSLDTVGSADQGDVGVFIEDDQDVFLVAEDYAEDDVFNEVGDQVSDWHDVAGDWFAVLTVYRGK